MPENEAEWDRWLRDFVGAIKGAMNRPESIPDAVVELAAEHFERKLPRFRVELRATLDHVASLVFYRTPLALLLEKAQQGKFDALETLLRINPALEVRSWVGDLMGSAVSAEGAQATQRFHASARLGAGPLSAGRPPGLVAIFPVVVAAATLTRLPHHPRPV